MAQEKPFEKHKKSEKKYQTQILFIICLFICITSVLSSLIKKYYGNALISPLPDRSDLILLKLVKRELKNSKTLEKSMLHFLNALVSSYWW